MAKAQVGDLIRIIENCWDDEDHLGKIYEVLSVEGDRELAYVDDTWNDGSRMGYLPREYEIHRKVGEEDAPKTESDAVNPQHYKQGRTEVIDIIEDAVTGAEPFEAVCQANILKYTLRYRHKNGVEDLKKAVWYAEKLIARLTQK